MKPLEVKPGGEEKGTMLVTRGIHNFGIAVALLLSLISVFLLVVLTIVV